VALPLALTTAAVSAGACGTVAGPPGAVPAHPVAIGGAETRAEGRLPNGVRVVIEENHAAPLVAIQVWVAGGAAADPPELAGAAHFFEHLAFRGTKRRAPGAAAREIEAVGGSIGAWTAPDEIVYHAAVAAPFLDLGFDVLGDALAAPTFDPAEVERARVAILGEIAAGRADPARRGGEALLEAAFAGAGLGYDRPVLGTEAAVAARTAAELRARFAESHVGGALTVVVVGDVDPAAARAAVGRAFAGIARGAARAGGASAARGIKSGTLGGFPSPPATDYARQAELRPRGRVTFASLPGRGAPATGAAARVGRSGEPAAAEDAEVVVGFRTATLTAAEAAALDLCAAVLVRGDPSRLEGELVHNHRLASAVRGYTFRGRAAGLLALGATASARKLEPAGTAIVDAALRLAREEVAANELDRARVAIDEDLARGEAGIEGRARRLGFAAAIADDLDWGTRYRRALRALDPSELRAAAAKLLRADAIAIAVLVPEGRADARAPDGPATVQTRLAAMVDGAEARADRAARAAGAPAADPATLAGTAGVSGGDVVRFVAPSGLRVLVLRDSSAPLVTVEAAWVVTAGGDGAGAAGDAAAPLVAGLLDRGTRTRSAGEVAAELRAAGGALEGFAAPGVLGVRADFLPSGVDRGLSLLADCLLRPSFPDAEIDGARRALAARREAASQSSDAGPRAALRLFHDTLWPDRAGPGDGDAAPVLGRVALLERYRRLYPVSRLVVAVVGDVAPAHVVATLASLFGGEAGVARASASTAAVPPSAATAAPPSAPSPAASAPSAAAPIEPTTVFRPSPAPDADVVVGYPTFASGDPDRLPMELLAEIVGGEGGRLASALGDDKTLAYRASARAARAAEPGYFAVQLTCAPPRMEAAVAAVRAALARVAAGGVTAEEVSRAARRLVGARAAGLRSRTAIVDALVADEARGLPPLAYRRDALAIARVGADDVARAARRALDPRREVIAVVAGTGNATGKVK
jgi:zinc protease